MSSLDSTSKLALSKAEWERNDNRTNYKRQNTRHVMKMKKNLEQIAGEDGRFSPPGIRFVYEGLGYTAKKVTVEPKHVTGQSLCEGLRKLALEKWGRMAMVVLNAWGIKTTSDFGEIVYNQQIQSMTSTMSMISRPSLKTSSNSKLKHKITST